MSDPAMLKESNEDRKAAAVRRKIERAHNYRVRTWAQYTLKIDAAQLELEVLGRKPVDLYTPDFNDKGLLATLTELPLDG